MAPKSYDVFLSFRGEDTRDGFTSHLHAALRRTSLSIFIDYNLVKGDEISPSLLQAIEASKTSIIVFSQSYASSKWCLDEIVKIMECRRLNGQVVIPVFYKVDPSHVRHQMGKYFDAFSEHERLFEGKTGRVRSWRAALKEAANLAGWDSSVIRPESTLIEHIVEDIVKKLSKASSSYNNGLEKSTGRGYGCPSFYEGAASLIREEPPSYSSSVMQSYGSFENPSAGQGSHSFESQDDERESSRTTHGGTALYDFTAGGVDELNLTAGEELEIEYEVDGWYYVKKKRPGRDGKMAGLVPVLYVSQP